MKLTWKGMCRTAMRGLAVFGVLMAGPGAVTAAGDGATQRPISDLLDVQYANPPFVIDFISGRAGAPEFRARLDFLGVIDNVLGNPFDSEFTGTITERVRSDGKTEVHIVLHARHVFGVVAEGGVITPDNLVWGRLAALAVPAGLSVNFCDVDFDLTYASNDAPGSTLPWIVQLMFNPRPDQEILQLQIRGSGKGELREYFGVEDGTPGIMTINEKGIHNVAFDDGHVEEGKLPYVGWPVANINIKPVGN